MLKGIRSLLMVVFATGFALGGPEGDRLHETPLSRRSIKLAMGSVEAVSGNLLLNTTLGPTLPGRIPLGFTWNYDNQDGLQAGTSGSSVQMGGQFRPIVWPSPWGFGDSPIQTVVLINGSPTVFFRRHNASSLPTIADLFSAMATRGVAPVAPTIPPPGFLLDTPGPLIITGVIPTSDGTKFLVGFAYQSTLEKFNPKTGTSTYSTRNLAPGYALIDGPNAIWAQWGNGSTPGGHNVSHFTNRWGDHISVDETSTNPSTGFPIVTQIVIKDEIKTTNSITLSVTLSGTPSISRRTGTDPANGLAYNYPWVYRSNATVNVSNTMGYPSGSMSGYLAAIQRFYPLPPFGCTGYSATAVPSPEGIWDQGIFPDWIRLTASDSTTRTTTITWPKPNGYPTSNPTEILNYNKLSERFAYAGVTRLSQLSFSKCDGTWNGFQYVRGTGDQEEDLGPTNSGVTSVVMTDTEVSSTPGQCYKILRVQPAWVGTPSGQNQTTWTLAVSESRTAIIHYPVADPSASSSYRAYRLTHPTYSSYAGDFSFRSYLFATSVVLFEESFTGMGLPSTPADLGTSPYAMTVFDGWDARSWANPNGYLTNGLPVNPIPLRSMEYVQGLPVKVRVVGNPNTANSRDAWGPILTDEYTGTSQNPPAKAGTDSSPLSTELPSSESYPIHRRGKIERSWNMPLMRLMTNSDQKSLDGSLLPSTRYSAASSLKDGSAPSSGISSVDFGTTSYGYDSVGRITSQQGVRLAFTSTEQRNYWDGFPLLKEVKKVSLTESSNAYYANPDAPSRIAGTDYTWADTHVQAGPSTATDKVDGRTTYFSYDGQTGRETSHTDVLGITTTTSYDPWGRKQTVTRQARGTVGAVSTTTTYDSNGRWKEESATSDGRTIRVRHALDAFGRTVSTTTFTSGSSLASSQSFVYDGFGQRINQSPVLLSNQTAWGTEGFIYDARGRLTHHYDTQGRLLSQVIQQPTWGPGPGTGGAITAVWTITQNDRGHQRAEALDLLGQKVAVVDQAGQLTRYFYNKDGKLLQTSQGSQQRSYEYNDMGWLKSKWEPEEGTTVFSRHTLFGVPLRIAQKGRSGSSERNVTLTTLDWYGMPATVFTTGPEGTVSRSLSYDHGTENTYLPTQVQESQPNGTVTETYQYDDLRRLRLKTVTDGSQSFTISRSLDAGGRMTSLVYPNQAGHSETVNYTYDDLFRPSTIGVTGEGFYRGSMTYDQVDAGANYKVSSILTLGNNAWTTTTTSKGELSRVQHVAPSGVLEDNSVTWTAGGLMLTRGADSFDYDALMRLSSAQVINPQTSTYVSQGFGYDRFGNRTTSITSHPAGTLSNTSEALSWTASYSGNDLPSVVSTTGGNLGTGVVYDDLGRMTQVWTTPGQSSTQTGWIYDSASRIVAENGTTYLLDAEGLRFRRRKSDGTTTYTVYGFNREPLVSYTNMVWNRSMIYGFGQLISENQPGGAIYVQSDQVGSPNLTTNASGMLINRSKNLPFGERLLDASPGVQKSVRRFTNHEEDPDSNAIYMQARSYLAAYGRFAQVDPAYDQTKDDPETWNLYNYVTNNPVTKTDPDGRTAYGSEMQEQQSAVLSHLSGSWDDVGFESGIDTHAVFNQMVMAAYAQNPSGVTQPVKGNQSETATTQGTSPTAQTNGIPALTPDQVNGTKDKFGPGGSILKDGTAPLKPGPDQDVVSLVSRPVDATGMGLKGLVVGLFEHSGTIIESKTGSMVVQSGPDASGKTNVASVTQGDPGKGLATFANGGTTTVRATWYVPAGSITKAGVNGLVNEFNARQLLYNAQSGNTTCNTFSRWFEGRLGLQVPQSTSFWMRGWNQVIP